MLNSIQIGKGTEAPFEKRIDEAYFNKLLILSIKSSCPVRA